MASLTNSTPMQTAEEVAKTTVAALGDSETETNAVAQPQSAATSGEAKDTNSTDSTTSPSQKEQGEKRIEMLHTAVHELNMNSCIESRTVSLQESYRSVCMAEEAILDQALHGSNNNWRRQTQSEILAATIGSMVEEAAPSQSTDT